MVAVYVINPFNAWFPANDNSHRWFLNNFIRLNISIVKFHSWSYTIPNLGRDPRAPLSSTNIEIIYRFNSISVTVVILMQASFSLTHKSLLIKHWLSACQTRVKRVPYVLQTQFLFSFVHSFNNFYKVFKWIQIYVLVLAFIRSKLEKLFLFALALYSLKIHNFKFTTRCNANKKSRSKFKLGKIKTHKFLQHGTSITSI